jgi:hypothetical protein
MDGPANAHVRRIKIALPFLNAKESFPVSVWFDGSPDKCDIKCRIPNVDCTVRHTSGILNDYVSVGRKLAAAAPAALIVVLDSVITWPGSSGDSEPKV